ncbi:hypothetical protein ABK040_004473 [Willaertia magna]
MKRRDKSEYEQFMMNFYTNNDSTKDYIGVSHSEAISTLNPKDKDECQSIIYFSYFRNIINKCLSFMIRQDQEKKNKLNEEKDQLVLNDIKREVVICFNSFNLNNSQSSKDFEMYCSAFKLLKAVLVDKQTPISDDLNNLEKNIDENTTNKKENETNNFIKEDILSILIFINYYLFKEFILNNKENISLLEDLEKKLENFKRIFKKILLFKGFIFCICTFINIYNLIPNTDLLSQVKYSFIKEVFKYCCYSNIIYPRETEMHLVNVGNEIVNFILSKSEISRKQAKFLQYCLRRISTSNLGRTNPQFTLFFTRVIQDNLVNNIHEEFIDFQQFKEGLLKVLDKPQIEVYFFENLSKFTKEKKISLVYLAINSMYCSFSIRPFHKFAHGLFNAYFTVYSENSLEKMELQERDVLLSHCLHNFHILFGEENNEYSYVYRASYCSVIPITVINVYAYQFAVFKYVQLQLNNSTLKTICKISLELLGIKAASYLLLFSEKIEPVLRKTVLTNAFDILNLFEENPESLLHFEKNKLLELLEDNVQYDYVSDNDSYSEVP